MDWVGWSDGPVRARVHLGRLDTCADITKQKFALLGLGLLLFELQRDVADGELSVHVLDRAPSYWRLAGLLGRPKRVPGAS